MKNKSRRTLLYSAMGLWLVSIICLTICLLLRDNLVTNYGIVMFRNIRSGAIGFVVGTGIIFVATAVYDKIKPKDNIEFTVDNQLLKRYTTTMYELTNSSKSNWKNEKVIVSDICKDVGIVVDYYIALGGEKLEVTFAELADIDDILHKVISAMLHNVDQLLRYMRVMHAEDANTVHIEIENCYERNSKLRAKAQDFVTSTLNYARNADKTDEGEAMIKIRNFKNIILGELDLADKYL